MCKQLHAVGPGEVFLPLMARALMSPELTRQALNLLSIAPIRFGEI